MKILLTQSEGKLLGLEPKLEELGLKVVHQALIATALVLGNHSYNEAKKIQNYPWLFFSSSKAIEFWHYLKMPFNSRLAVVGKSTAKALLKYKKPEIIAQTANAKGLLDSFLQHPDKQAPVGIIKGNLSLNILEQGLKANNIEYRSLTAYLTAKRKITCKSADIVLLASPSAVDALPPKLSQAKLISIGSTTAQAIANKGWQSYMAKEPSVNSIIKTIEGLL